MRAFILTVGLGGIFLTGCATSKSTEVRGNSGSAQVPAATTQKAPGKPINTKAPATDGTNTVNHYPTAAQ